MTTFDPGARLVFTHGLRSRPRSIAFLASSPAPTITEGLEVLVQLVIAAITTAPWKSSNSVPFSSLTGAPDGGSVTAVAVGSRPASGSGSPAPVMPAIAAGGSLAGNDSAEDSSAS